MIFPSLDYGLSGRTSHVFLTVFDPSDLSVLQARSAANIGEAGSTGGYVLIGGISTDAAFCVWDDDGSLLRSEMVTSGGSGSATFPPIALVTGQAGGTLSDLDFVMKRNDNEPHLIRQIIVPDPADASGNTYIPYQIPDGSTVKLTIRPRSEVPGGASVFTTSPLLHDTMTIVDGVNGIVSYPWTQKMTTSGEFYGEIEVTDPDSNITSFPQGVFADESSPNNWLNIHVIADLDPGIEP